MSVGSGSANSHWYGLDLKCPPKAMNATPSFQLMVSPEALLEEVQHRVNSSRVYVLSGLLPSPTCASWLLWTEQLPSSTLICHNVSALPRAYRQQNQLTTAWNLWYYMSQNTFWYFVTAMKSWLNHSSVKNHLYWTYFLNNTTTIYIVLAVRSNL